MWLPGAVQPSVVSSRVLSLSCENKLPVQPQLSTGTYGACIGLRRRFVLFVKLSD